MSEQKIEKTRNILLNRAERISLAVFQRDLEQLQAQANQIVTARNEVIEDILEKHNLPSSTRLEPIEGQEGSFVAVFPAQDAVNEGKIIELPATGSGPRE